MLCSFFNLRGIKRKLRGLLPRPLAVFLAVKSQADLFPLFLGLHMDRPFPNPLEVHQGVPGEIPLEVPSFVLMGQEKLPPVFEIAFHDPDEGMPQVGQAVQEDPLDLGKLPVLDHPGFLTFILAIHE
jgi:hypothetical protein